MCDGPNNSALRLQLVLRFRGMPAAAGTCRGADGRLRRPGEPARHYPRQERTGEAVWRSDGGNHLAGKTQMPRPCADRNPFSGVPETLAANQRDLPALHRHGGAVQHRRKLARRNRQLRAVRQRQNDCRRAARRHPPGNRADGFGWRLVQQNLCETGKRL